ncbi:radical SAM protein [Candidatus Pacearchaeota archaeon]|jgi:MoaA/NifB/PqqE/SkfB family radical SAM enzyme|nr:radical SAM protein [Candidatus Pacearchaeota archaeon]
MPAISEINTDYEEKFLKFLNRGKIPQDFERQLIKDHSDRVKAILEGKNPPPYEVEIQPYSICNLKCSHCFGKNEKKLPNYIDEKGMEEIARKIDEFKEDGFKIEVAKFCGTTGEPLMNRAIIRGIELFKKQGQKIIVFTNGLMLDKKANGKTYGDYILEADKLNLSLDAGSEETFFSLKGREGFNRIVKSLDYLVNERLNTGSKLKISVSYVIGEKNYHDIINATRIIKKTGADEISFRIDFMNPKNIEKLSSSILTDLEEAMKYKDDTFVVNSVYSKDEISGKKSDAFISKGRRCFNRYFWACIGPDCNLYACGHRTHGGVKSYGSILNNSFKDLWNSDGRLASVKNLPDLDCKVCSPSSLRRNDFMTFLDKTCKEEGYEKVCKMINI